MSKKDVMIYAAGIALVVSAAVVWASNNVDAVEDMIG